MLVRVRERPGADWHVVAVPSGGRTEKDRAGKAYLVIPGELPGDTSTLVPAERVLADARQGRHGLRLVQVETHNPQLHVTYRLRG